MYVKPRQQWYKHTNLGFFLIISRKSRGVQHSPSHGLRASVLWAALTPLSPSRSAGFYLCSRQEEDREKGRDADQASWAFCKLTQACPPDSPLSWTASPFSYKSSCILPLQTKLVSGRKKKNIQRLEIGLTTGSVCLYLHFKQRKMQ